MTLRLFIITVLLIISHQVPAQIMADSLMSEHTTIDWYDKQVGRHNTILQYGELADLTRKSHNSHPYYGTDKWTLTTITYYGQTFNNIYSLFDIEQDVLIINNNLGNNLLDNPMKLRKEGISTFIIDAEKFKLLDDTLSWQHQGFYKIVYEGNIVVLLCKVFKNLQFEYRALTFKEHHHYFLQMDGDYYRLRRIASLLKIFPEHKKEIRQYKKKIKLKKINNPDNEDKLAQLIEYCEVINRK